MVTNNLEIEAMIDYMLLQEDIEYAATEFGVVTPEEEAATPDL